MPTNAAAALNLHPQKGRGMHLQQDEILKNSIMEPAADEILKISMLDPSQSMLDETEFQIVDEADGLPQVVETDSMPHFKTGRFALVDPPEFLEQQNQLFQQSDHMTKNKARYRIDERSRQLNQQEFAGQHTMGSSQQWGLLWQCVLCQTGC